jgi:hypothetical protein
MMKIYEILFWNNDPADKVRPDPQLQLPPTHFGDDLTNLANAFTRRGLVKHLWNPKRSEEQPSGPAPPEAEPSLNLNRTLEPSAASSAAEPDETERSVRQRELVPFRRAR